MLKDPRDIDIEKEGRSRTGIHINHSSNRPYATGRMGMENIIGLKGEKQFAMEFGYKVDMTVRPEGDGGKDFNTPIGDLNVKTARNPVFLLVPVGRKPRVEIFCLAYWREDTDRTMLVGWEYKREMALCPTKEFGYPILNHFKRSNELRSMEELKELCGVGRITIPWIEKETIPSVSAVQAWAACGLKVSQERIDSHNAIIREWQERIFKKWELYEG